MITKWEYKTVTSQKDAEGVMNKYGETGWELVFMKCIEGFRNELLATTMVFKRKKGTKIDKKVAKNSKA